MDGFNNNQKINPQMKRRYVEKNIIKMDQGSKILALGEGDWILDLDWSSGVEMQEL